MLLSSALRCLSVDMVEKAQSGHPGLPLGMADVVTVLYRDFLHFNPLDPLHPARDRFILSAGHGSAMLYALLHLTGYQKPTLEDLKQFRQLYSCTPGHPEYGSLPGIETTTGPLGQGLATAVGIALAQHLSKSPSHTYVLVSDGDLMEGISQEAISFAGHHSLSSLTVLWDDNNITIDGPLHLSSSENQLKRFEAAGWFVHHIDGHNEQEIIQALSLPSDRPRLIGCRTIIGKGAPKKQGTASCHGSPLGKEETEALKQSLGCPLEPFFIPEILMNAWRAIGVQGGERLDKRKKIDSLDQKNDFSIFEKIKKDFPPQLEATRQTSARVLEAIAPFFPKMIGGSSDLTLSNNTKTKDGLYIHYGIREHAMAAIMNGLSLSGWQPYGGTFLVFSDYLRPALRLSCLMELPVIYVLTHDSIGVGEDGPTHQPIEHLSALRSIPNLNVFRPCDALEVIESWQIALESETTPSVIVLTRQAVKTYRHRAPVDNFTKRGGYIMREASTSSPQITLVATGSEVDLALQAQEILEKKGIRTRVISLVCWRLFEQQNKDYQEAVLGIAPRLGIEAGCDVGWHKYVSHFMGVSSFGYSGPADAVFKHFGLTVDHVIKKCDEILTLC